MLNVTILIVAAYFLGAIPFGKLAGLAKGVDIQAKGSGNIGFANVLRVLGWRWAVPVLIGDAGKGFLAVWLATHFDGRSAVVLLAAAAVLLGHVFPIWLRFRGGKAIATGLGVALLLTPLAALGALAVYGLTYLFVRAPSIASLAGACSLPAWAALWTPRYVWFFVVAAVFVFWTHRTNLRRIWKLHGQR
jgi:glycerol-3-phosphate acyltransferase PlsY